MQYFHPGALAGKRSEDTADQPSQRSQAMGVNAYPGAFATRHEVVARVSAIRKRQSSNGFNALRCSQFFFDQFAFLSATCMVNAWRDLAERFWEL